MKRYFAYVRVSTVRQGEKGSSLVEQKSAIEAYAARHGLTVSAWYEEQETAAATGRPVFSAMLKRLLVGAASGVITHKIDRSARNLKDWAQLGDLIDRGIEMHFAHEAIDLTSRGGRLSADIQAVVAADYIRNLRDEVRKGFYGRLKQGLTPLQAPLGYENNGGGKAKTIDPVRGPLVRRAFDLYATGTWSFDGLRAELTACGLRNRAGKPISQNGLSTILNNPFYVGIIRVKSTGETFQGIHEPLVSKRVFDAVQDVLKGRTPHHGHKHRYRYQRLIRCAGCGYHLIAECQKGRVYYRCHTTTCAVSYREDRLDERLADLFAPLRFTDDELREIASEVDRVLSSETVSTDELRKSLDLSLAAVAERISRLTDAYLDQAIDRETFAARKEQLLHEQAALKERLVAVASNGDQVRELAQSILELLKTLQTLAKMENSHAFRRVLEKTTSNLTATEENVVVAWQNPFQRLCESMSVTYGGR